MIYKKINGTDLLPSCISLGTVEYGSSISKTEAFKIMDYYWDKGGNFIDTAHIYADWMSSEKSMSEKTIGLWLKARNNRNNVILATKGSHPDFAAMHISRLSNKDITNDLEESLKYLQVDHIDLYLLHRDDISVPVGDILETLNSHVIKGNIRYFGCSNWKTSRIIEAKEYAEKHKIGSFVANQIMWSLAKPNTDTITDKTIEIMDESAIQYHKSSGMAVMAYTSQARGFFSKVFGGTPLKDGVKATYNNEENLLILERLKYLTRELDTSIDALVLSYLTSQPFACMPIVGSQSLAQLSSSMTASDIVLTSEMLNFLENSDNSNTNLK